MAMDKPWRVTQLSSFDGVSDSVYQSRAFLGGVIYGSGAAAAASITVWDSAEDKGEPGVNPVLVAHVGDDARSIHIDLSGAPIPMDNGIAFKPSTTGDVTIIWAPRGSNE